MMGLGMGNINPHIAGASSQGLVRESTLIREAIQAYRQTPDEDTRLAVTRQALDQVVLHGSATEQQIAESTLDSVGRCRILRESAAKTYEIALSTMLVALPPAIGVATVLAFIGKESMAQIDPSDGLRVGESFLYEAGRHGGGAEQAVAQAGRAIGNDLGPDGGALIFQSAFTTLTNLGESPRPSEFVEVSRLTGTAQSGLERFQLQTKIDLGWADDDLVTPREKTRVSSHLNYMLERGEPRLPEPGVEDPHFLIAKKFM